MSPNLVPATSVSLTLHVDKEVDNGLRRIGLSTLQY